MTTHDDYTVGWVCTLPVEVEAAKAMLDRIHADLHTDSGVSDTNNYVLGGINNHNVVLAYPSLSVGTASSLAAVITQMRARFRSIRCSLIVGTGGGVPSMKEDIRLGDIVVGKPTSDRPGLIRYESGREESVEKTYMRSETSNGLPDILQTATSKAETNHILGETQIARYISEVVQKDPLTFGHPGPEQDVLFEPDYNHIITRSAESGCAYCESNRVTLRPTRSNRIPKVHYGVVAYADRPICHGIARDELARNHGILSFFTGEAGLISLMKCLVIRGISDYADSHKNQLWQGYAAVTAAAYAKEILLLIPTAPKPVSLEGDIYAVATSALDALLLTRPDVDRSSLIALKGGRVNGTCEWLVQHSKYQEWLEGSGSPLWISGGPGKGKTMLGIYLTEKLQPVVDTSHGILLYYFCSNRDRNRNTAIAIMRGIIHQWLTLRPQLAQHIKTWFEVSETAKYTISSFDSLWRVFMILLHQSGTCQVVCVLDGLDECENRSLQQLLDALEEYFPNHTEDESLERVLKLIILSRPQPMILENKLGGYRRIRLDESTTEVGEDVERYISAKVKELESEQNLSEFMLREVQQTLRAGAEGTFLWVGFVADELKGRSWEKIKRILEGVPKGLGGIYQRLLQQVEAKEELVAILQWVVLASRPLTVDELALAAGIKASNGLTPVQVTKSRLASCGLLIKFDGDVVNLVHESAKDFFQSEKVKTDGIRMFYMDQMTHRTLLRTCIELIERNYNSSGSIKIVSRHNTLLAYASLHWPEHFRHASDLNDRSSALSSQFFQEKSPVRDDWWSFYWDQENYGGAPPSFTLMHLAAFFGNLAWAKMILKGHSTYRVKFRHLTSRKDNYGRTPLFWAATRGHRDMVKLLLDHGAHVNSKDRSKLTALHIAVTGDHKDVVTLLLDRSARIESKGSHGDTPLIRAIQANSTDIISLLLERGARVDELPIPPGVASLKRPTEPLEERTKQLLGLQEQLLAARYEDSSRLVDFTINALTLSFKFSPILHLVTLYLKHSSMGRWEVMNVLQDLVKNNRTTRLRKWAESYIQFGTQLVEARNARNLTNMTGLSVLVFQVVSTPDLEALLVIGVLVGSSVILAAAQQAWKEGVDISARTFAQFASLAYQRDAQESLHYGVREFLVDFDHSIWSGRNAENVSRTVVLFSTHFAILDTQDPQPIKYFSTVIAEYYERFIGGVYEEQLFNDASQACANELSDVSDSHDSHRLLLFLTAILQFSQRSRDKGQERFLNMLPASCLILCQKAPSAHQWLIAEAVPKTMSALISLQQEEHIRKSAFKALVEFLIIGRQYKLPLPIFLQETLKRNLGAIDGVDGVLRQIQSV